MNIKSLITAIIVSQEEKQQQFHLLQARIEKSIDRLYCKVKDRHKTTTSIIPYNIIDTRMIIMLCDQCMQ